MRMIVEEENVVELKKWIVKRLENISDADSDVLADYVLALIRAESPDSELRLTAIESLEDFLRDNTTAFVDEVFLAIRSKSYLPGSKLPSAVTSGSPQLPAPVRSGSYGPLSAGRAPYEGLQQSRKRSYNDRQDNGDGTDSQYMHGDRPMKQTRRGGKAGRGDGHGNRGGRLAFQDSFSNAGLPPLAQSFQNMPMLPGMSFDPNDPMAAIMAMQAMGMPPLPVPTIPTTDPANGLSRYIGQDKGRERCRDYDTQGYCARGDACSYEHGTDRLIVPGDEYDPKTAGNVGLQRPPSKTNGHQSPIAHRAGGFIRGQGRGRGDRGGFPSRRQNRADFSSAGPNHDRSVTTIVIEQIPEERFTEQSVREFFSGFGNIHEVTMQPYKRLATVRYDDYSAARSAYESPKVVFDNRFVKVYWYKPNALATPPSTAKPSANSPTEESGPSPEEIERNVAAAQKKFEEKKERDNAQKKEIQAKLEAIAKQKEQLEQKQATEKRKLIEQLKAKGGAADDALIIDSENNEVNFKHYGKVSAHTKALREKVAELEAEAQSLGLDSVVTDYPPRGRDKRRGRGSYRGWEGFAARGGGFDSVRGRGRGAFGPRGGGRYNLDNRTKKVAVSGVEFAPEKDEALRQHLLGIGEFEAIGSHPDSPNTQIVTFKDRPTAEAFMYGSKDIPSVGKLDLAWHNASAASASSSTTGGNTIMKTGATDSHHGDANQAAEMDYDVAEEDDRWR